MKSQEKDTINRRIRRETIVDSNRVLTRSHSLRVAQELNEMSVQHTPPAKSTTESGPPPASSLPMLRSGPSNYPPPALPLAQTHCPPPVSHHQPDLPPPHVQLPSSTGAVSRNTSSSESIAAPSYSSVSEQGAAALDYTESSFRTLQAAESHQDLSNMAGAIPVQADHGTLSISADLKACINMAVGSAFSSYQNSLREDISQSLREEMRINFLNFMRDINVVTRPNPPAEVPVPGPSAQATGIPWPTTKRPTVSMAQPQSDPASMPFSQTAAPPAIPPVNANTIPPSNPPPNYSTSRDSGPRRSGYSRACHHTYHPEQVPHSQMMQPPLAFSGPPPRPPDSYVQSGPRGPIKIDK